MFENIYVKLLVVASSEMWVEDNDKRNLGILTNIWMFGEFTGVNFVYKIIKVSSIQVNKT